MSYSYHKSDSSTSTDMLASSMMLVSISEDLPVCDIGYKSSITTSQSSSGSNNMVGWGSSLSRKSYTLDLCSLGGESENGQQLNSTNVPQYQCADFQEQNEDDSSWGFYVTPQQASSLGR